jgi:hypothetical protein
MLNLLYTPTDLLNATHIVRNHEGIKDRKDEKTTHCFQIYWVHLLQSLQVITAIGVKDISNEAVHLSKVRHNCIWNSMNSSCIG